MLSQASRLLCLLLHAPSAAPSAALAPALEGDDAMAADEAAEAAPALDAIGALLLVSGTPSLADLPSPPSAAEAAALPPTSSVAGARGAVVDLAAACCVDPLDVSVQDAAGVARLAPSPAASAADAVDAARLQLAREAAVLRGACGGAVRREAFDAAVRARVLTAFKKARERQAEASAAVGRARAEVRDVGGCPPLLMQQLTSAVYVEAGEGREAGTLARLLGELCCGEDAWMARPSKLTLALALTHLAHSRSTTLSFLLHPHLDAHLHPYLHPPHPHPTFALAYALPPHSPHVPPL